MSEFERKFSAFSGRHWYAEMADRWAESDEGMEAMLEAMLVDLARSEGLILPNDRCGRCDCDLPDVHAGDDWYGALCFTCCEQEEEKREQAQLALIEDVRWWYRLTPDERERERARVQQTMTWMVHGLVARDVQ